MCGIIGYVGPKLAAPILLGGLKRLEYRGYDSAGLALCDKGALFVVRATGKLRNLEAKLAESPPPGRVGIGHTRWATHGRPSDENAHPHTFGLVSVVHNGIIENYLELKAELARDGHSFSSETDTEILAHLIDAGLRGGATLAQAVVRCLSKVRGTYALAVVSSAEPDVLVVARDSQPMVVGLGTGENFVASDVAAIIEHTRDVVFLEDGDVAIVRDRSVQFIDKSGAAVSREVERIDWSISAAEKGGHKHFMHKEIWEQPRAVADTLRGRLLRAEGDVHFDGWPLSPERTRGISKIWVLACGTSYHAGLVGKWLIERWARIPVEVAHASEFRYSEPILDRTHLAIAVSQSGETLDTLAALREAKRRGALTLAVCNAIGSTMTREAEAVIMTRAGPEIGVASTKAFTTQLAVFHLLALKLARATGALSAEQTQAHLAELALAPSGIEAVLAREAQVRAIARRFQGARGFLFLGRGPLYPVALEGALKLKEITYIHAEGYPGGEMKHGPIALIDESLPVVAIALREPRATYEKMIGNIQEVRARGAPVIAIVDEGDKAIAAMATEVIEVPAGSTGLGPILATIPLQLLAYHVAEERGTDVDQPRNLAKSVTVE